MPRSRPLRPLLLAAVLPLLAATPASAALDPEARCIDTKLKAAAMHGKKLLACHAKAVRKGEAVDSACIGRADDRLDDLFARAEARGGCPVTGDVERVRRFSNGVAGRTVVTLAPWGGPSVCASLQLKAGGLRLFKSAVAHGKHVKKGDRARLVADFSELEDVFSRKHGKAIKHGDCDGTDDPARVAGVIDAGLDVLYAASRLVSSETVTLPSDAQPPGTPGSPGVDANDYPKLVTQLGSTDFSLNNAVYTRFFLNQVVPGAPDAILILVPGFEGGALSFKILAENAVSRALENELHLEVWAYDRRGHQLEDLVGQDIAEAALDPQIALDWYFGAELGLTLHPDLVAGPDRRAILHDPQADTAFIANWTPLVFSRDIDAMVERARTIAINQNVYLGGHSAGTGFTARYAATDFDLSGIGSPEPGYAKLRGLVLLEGGGGSTGDPLSEDGLDRIEDRADGGLFAAVRDNAPRCADGTPCPGGDADCTGIGRGTCTDPTAAYAIVPGLLNPRVLLSSEPGAIQAASGDADDGLIIILQDQGSIVGNNAVAVVPDLAVLTLLGKGTAHGGLGAFLDDDGFISSLATFVRTSIGAPGPVVNGIKTWKDITEVPMPASVLPDNGPAPTALPTAEWGIETEPTRLDRLMETFFAGGSNFTDWYYPSSGISTTEGVGLDSSQLSAGRGRTDIENLTQAANVDIPVICFGGTNGLTEAPVSFLAFAQSLGTCAASPDCDGTPRVVDASLPSEAFPTFGGEAGGFEVHLSEGYAHVDIVTAEDDADNNVVGPLIDFVLRNNQ